METLHRRSFHGTYDWLMNHPNEWRWNYSISLFITLLATGITGRTRLTYGILFPLATAAGFISGLSMNQTALPLLPWDILLPGSRQDPLQALNPALTRGLMTTAAASLGVCCIVLLVRNVRLGWQGRLAVSAAASFLLLSVCRNAPLPLRDSFRITAIYYEQEANYNRNGFLASSIDNLRFAMPVRPHGAGSKEIGKLVRSLEQRQARHETAAIPEQGATREQPNVIVLLSESFWDPTLLPRVEFSEDPIPFFHSLMDKTTSGWMLSPQFSGTTANVEFEVLSGNSIRFLPEDAVAYISYMNREVDSLASILARQGYTSTVVNPYFNWFFNSRQVYRNFGFSRFISCEFFEPRFHGPNFEDSQVMDKIMEAVADTPGPDFVFANTMENHGPYEDKFYSSPITASGSFSSKTKNILENYAAGEQAFDKALRTLVEHFDQTGEPTVILVFGDHLPGLGPNYLAYRETGYITGGQDQDLMDKIQYTPFIIWDNMQLHPKESLRMNASFLGPYLLNYANRPGSYYTDFLYGLYRQEPVIPIRSFRRQHPFPEERLTDYKRLQYDILFGRQSGYKEAGITGGIRSATFTLGYGSPILEHAAISKDGLLELSGGRFSSDSSIWLNGHKLPTTYDGPSKLTARMGSLSSGPELPWNIQVKLTDRKNTVISQSETMVVPHLEQ
jgi:hypothetical protein